MIRSSLVSGFLTILTLSFVSVPVATADPIVDSAFRGVYGYLHTPIAGQPPPQQVYTYDTSGPSVAHIQDAQTDASASAAYEADLDASISEFIIEGIGSSSALVATTDPSQTWAFADSYMYVNFTLDGNYNYSYSGTVLANLGAYAGAYLYSYASGMVHYHQTYDGVVPFAYFGTLGAGTYQFYLYTQSYRDGFAGESGGSSGSFDGTLTLTPTTVPDGGDTAILFLFGSALLGAFALGLQERRQSP